MKLSFLFESIILEETAKANQIISEGVSADAINDAINKKYMVNILYRDYEDQPPSRRYVQVYDYGVTKAGNDAISAWQIFGGSKTTPHTGAWKMFRLDRIEGWFKTDVKWLKPIDMKDPSVPKFNRTGNRNMSKIYNKIKFLNK